MKKLGLFLAVCMLLAAFGTQPAAAQEPEYGFVPLLTEGYDASLPREVTSQASFDRLLPRLMEAKALGLIADFEPDFYGGYMRVTNASAELRGSAALFPVFSSRDEAVVRPPLSAAKVGSRTATISFYSQLYSSYFDVYTGIPGAHIKGTLKSPGGEVLGVIDGYADSEGDFWDYWDGYSDSNVPGYKVSFTVRDAGGVLVGTYSVTIPRITFNSITKSTGQVSGSASAGKSYWAYMYHPNLDSGNTAYFESKDGTTSATGKWSLDFSKAMRGGDQVGIQVQQNSNFTFSRYMQAPRVECRLMSNYCYLDNLPNKSVELSLNHGGTTYKVSGKTNVYGYLAGSFYNSSGDPVLIAVGDKVAGTDAVTESFPKLTLTANRAANTVSGTAPANKWFEVAIELWNPYDYQWVWVKSDAAGAFTASFSLDIPAKGTIEPDIWYINPSTGNYWYYYKMIP